MLMVLVVEEDQYPGSLKINVGPMAMALSLLVREERKAPNNVVGRLLLRRRESQNHSPLSCH